MDRVEILQNLTRPSLFGLTARANCVREEMKGDVVHLRGIIEFSSHCVRDCVYCGLRRSNRHLDRYRIAPDRVVELALGVAAAGVSTVVLQSGDDLAYAASDIAGIVRRIKDRAEIKVTLSVGERPFSDYEMWRHAGADRYLMRHETANPDLYARLHPGKRLQERLAALLFLKDLGYEIGNGMIVGLPGQTLSDLADDILLTRRLGVRMCGVGPFIPQSGTPCRDFPNGSLETTLRVIAVLRLVCPENNLPATTALATLDPLDAQLLALISGANVLMPVFTPAAVRGGYRIYDNKAGVSLEQAKETISRAMRKVAGQGEESQACRARPRVSGSISASTADETLESLLC